MHGSLRRKILALSFLPATIILFVVAVGTYFVSQSVAESLVIDRDQELARLTAAELSGSLSDYPALLAGIGRDLTTANVSRPAVRTALVDNANRLTYFDGGAILLSNLGRVIASYPDQPRLQDRDWSDRSYFRQIIQNPGRSVYSDIVSDGPDGSDVLAVAVPVYGTRNELRGVLVGMFRIGTETLNPFYGTLVRLRLDRKGASHIIDGNGRVIFATDTPEAGQDFRDHPVAELALSGESGALRTRTDDGSEVLASYSPIPNTSWSLVIEEDWDQLMLPLQRYSMILITLLAMGIIVPALFVFSGMQRVTRPINSLVEASRQVARGDFGWTVEAHTGDELEVLAEQFNQMSAELKRSYSRLEQRVEERTRELQTVLEVSRNFSSILELEPLLAKILDQLRSVVDYRLARLWILEGDEMVLLQERGDSYDLGENAYLSGFKETEDMLATGEPLLIADTTVETPFVLKLREMIRARGKAELIGTIGSLLSLPLIARERRVGTLNLAHDERGYYTPQRAEIALAFASQAAIAIENAGLFAAEQERVEQFKMINEVSRRIAGILDVESLLRETALLIHERFEYYHVAIGLVEDDYIVYRTHAGRLVNADADDEFGPLRLRIGTDGLTGRAAASGMPIIVPDVRADSRYTTFSNLDTRSEMVVPIKSQEVVLGVVDIQSEKVNQFDQTDLDIMQLLANQLAVAIENARLYEQAGKLAALEERQKLARELHDSVSQALYGIALGTRTARTVVERSTLDESLRASLDEPLEYILSQADAGMAEMRALIFELRPESLQTEGLVAALRKQTAALQARHQIPVTVSFGAEPELPIAQKEMLYRVAQEAMHNIVKHAQATRAEVRLHSQNGRVILEVADNGQGFDLTQEFPGHLGLKSMRERVERAGGMLTIASDVGSGTRIQVKIGR